MTLGRSSAFIVKPAGATPVDELLQRLHDSGIRVWIEGGHLRYRAKQGTFTEELKEEVRRWRPELIAYLQAAEPAAADGIEKRPGRSGTIIAKLSAGASIPLSFMQRRLWLLEESGAGSSYNVAFAFRVEGHLDLDALERACRDLLERQEALRSRLCFEGGEPRQFIDPDPGFRIERVACSEASPEERAHTARELADRPFVLTRDTLFRVFWMDCSPAGGILLFAMHHWVTDLWSNPIFFRELSALYRRHCGEASGETSALPPLAVQYSDFAAWQERWLSGAQGAGQLAYWKHRLAGSPVLELPLDRRRPAQFTFRGGRRTLDLDARSAERIEGFRRQEGSTTFLVMLAAWCLLLHKYSGSEDILTAAPVSNRDAPELEDLIGFFVNTVPLRQRINPSASFREFLAQVTETTSEDLENGQAPLEAILEHILIPRGADRNPLFQHVLVVNPPAEGGFSLPGVQMKAYPLSYASSKFDITLFVQPGSSGLRLACEYSSDLFLPESALELLKRFRVLLETAVAQPDLPVKDLSLLQDGDLERLGAWNLTGRPYPRDQTIHGRFAEMAERFASGPAVLGSAGSWTYRELDSAAESIAVRLAAHGLASGTPVGVYLERSPWLVAALLGILRAGCLYCPIDLRYPPSRVQSSLELARCAALVTEASLRAQATAFSGPVLEIDPAAAPPVAGSAHGLAGDAPAKAGMPVRAEDPAYVNFTSGSTGQPKGVLVPHRAVLRLVFGIPGVGFDSSTRILHASSIGFDASTFEIWAPLLHGGACCLHPESIPSASGLEESICRHGIDTVFFTTGLFNAVVEAKPTALGGLRRILTGGEVMSLHHVIEAYRHLPDLQIFNVYGPTENTTFTTCYPVSRDLPEHAASVPIGFPLANTRLYVVDAYLHRAPPGMPGELLIAGEGLALEYIHDLERTNEAFITHAFDPGNPPERLYRSGDIVRFLADGSLEFLGRRDNQVKIRGFRVEPGEVEAVLHSCPGVASAVVIADRDETGSLRLLGYYTSSPELRAEEEAVRQRLSERLPEYMRPSALMEVETFPLNASGKVDRNALPKPPLAQASSTPGSESPANLWELQLCQIFRDVLGVEKVGPLDDFFQLGGASLTAVKVFAQAEAVFRHRLPLAALFRSPVVRQLAAEFRQSKKGKWSALVPIQPHGQLPPVFWLHTLGGGGGGGLLRYRETALRLGGDRPSFGIEAPEEPFQDFESMARHYTDVITRFRPEGPYCLAGFCFGGNVAYAVACEMERRGIPVAAVFLLESSPAGRLPGGFLRYALTPTGLGVLARRGCFYLRMPWSSWQRLPRKLISRLRRRRRSSSRVATAGLGDIPEEQLDAPISLAEYPPHLRRYVQTHWNALLRYAPRRYSGPVVIFRVAKPLSYAAMRPDFGWSEWVSGKLTVEKIRGDHHHFLEPPAVDHLAERMRAQLAPFV
ncbi:MAG TPA: amino acid adenylation domain-containing protein [Verrucomicrobiales bacterium]|nr:amino acid adenylation domain-containing protein [Verrucomicrobiales bacterium]